MVNARSKGKRGEYAVRDILQEILDEELMYPPTVERNITQTRGGGADLVGIDWLAVEVKNRETVHLNAWWAQTERQAKPGQIPVLFWKRNGVPWHVRMVKNGVAVVDITLDEFVAWFRNEIRSRYAESTTQTLHDL